MCMCNILTPQGGVLRVKVIERQSVLKMVLRGVRWGKADINNFDTLL